MVRLGHISEVDVLFTDRIPPKAIQEVLEKANVVLHVIGTAGSEDDDINETTSETGAV